MDRGTFPLIARLLALLVSLALPSGALADASSGAYKSPNFDAALFERDALSLQGKDRSEVVAALTAVAENFPLVPTVDTDVKEKALAIALRLEPLNASARSAHQTLLTGLKESGDGASLSSAIQFANGAEVFAALAPRGINLWQQRAQPDDEVLAPLLIEIALTVLSQAEWEAAEVQAVAFQYRQMCATTDPVSLWADVVEMQPISGDGASKLASRLRALPTTPVAVTAPKPVVVPSAPTSTPAPSSLPTIEPPAAPSSDDLEIKRDVAVVPFVFYDDENGAVASGTVRMKISPLDETERSLLGLFGDQKGPPPMRLTMDDGGSRSVEVTGFTAAETWARDSFSAWPSSKTARIDLRREREDSSVAPRPMRQENDPDKIDSSPEPRNVSLPLALLLHSAFSGEQIDTAFAVSGQLTESGELTLSDNLPTAEALKKFGSYGDKLSLASVPTAALSDESLRDALVLGEVDLFIAPQTIAVQSADELAQVAVAENRPPKLRDAMALFNEVEQLDNLAEKLGNSFVKEKLRQVVELWPAHLSAQMLLLAGDAEKRPALLSKNGSVRAVNRALAPLRETYESDLGFQSEVFDVDELVAEARLQLHSVDGKLSSDARNYLLAAEDLVVLFKDYLSLKNRDAGNANAEQHRRTLNDRLQSLELLVPATG
jgi:hypothetical protein